MNIHLLDEQFYKQKKEYYKQYRDKLKSQINSNNSIYNCNKFTELPELHVLKDLNKSTCKSILLYVIRFKKKQYKIKNHHANRNKEIRKLLHYFWFVCYSTMSSIRYHYGKIYISEYYPIQHLLYGLKNEFAI